MAHIRKLGRRSVERGSLLSDELPLREMQLRFLGSVAAIAAFFCFFAYRKFISLFGLVPVVAVTVVVVGGALAAFIKSRRSVREEPKDTELELPDTELVLVGALGVLLLNFGRFFSWLVEVD